MAAQLLLDRAGRGRDRHVRCDRGQDEQVDFVRADPGRFQGAARGFGRVARQRLAVARALFHRPPLLLCDEPTGNLDTATAAEVLELLGSIHREDGVTVIAASHDEAITAVADRVFGLQEGSLSALGEGA